MSENKPVLVLSAPVLNNSGYGRHATDIACSLLRYGKYDLKIAFQRWGSCPSVNLEEEKKTNPYVDRLLGCMIRGPLSEQPEVWMQVSIPNEFNPVGKFNIGITAGIETTVPNGAWLEGLNRMNVNVVPSKHSKDVFQSVKMTKQLENGAKVEVSSEKPIEVIFEGCDTNIYKKVKSDDNSKLDKYMNTIPEDFVFLFVGHWIQGDFGHDRKDIGTLIKLFSEIFKNKKDKPALLLKTSGATLSIVDKDEILNKIKLIRDTVEGELPNIYLLHGELSDSEMNELYNHSKVKAMVNFTHGEGFGRPLLEFSMSGKPIIASGWSGHIDFLNKEYTTLIPGTLQPVHPSCVNEWIIKEGQWVYINQSTAARALDDMYKNYGSYLEKSEKLRIENSNKFSLSEFDKVFWKYLDTVIPEFPKRAQIILPKLKLKKTS